MDVGAGDRRARGVDFGVWRVHANESLARAGPPRASAALPALSVVLELPRLSKQRRGLRARLGGFCGRCLPPPSAHVWNMGPLPQHGRRCPSPRGSRPQTPLFEPLVEGGVPTPLPSGKYPPVCPPKQGVMPPRPWLAAGRGVCARGGLGFPNGGACYGRWGGGVSSPLALLHWRIKRWPGWAWRWLLDLLGCGAQEQLG